MPSKSHIGGRCDILLFLNSSATLLVESYVSYIKAVPIEYSFEYFSHK